MPIAGLFAGLWHQTAAACQGNPIQHKTLLMPQTPNSGPASLLNCSRLDIACQVLTQCPRLLSYSIDQKLKPTVAFFQALGLTKTDMGRMLTICPSLLGYNLESRLRPSVEFLKTIGIQDIQLQKLLTFFPNILVRKAEVTFKPVLEHLHGVGFTSQQVTSIVAGYPPVLTRSIANSVQPKLEFLVHTMGRSVQEVVEFPAFFGCSLRKTIAPRYRLLGDHASACSLVAMLACSGSKFNHRFGLREPFLAGSGTLFYS